METLAEDLGTMVRRPLLPEHVEAMRAVGAEMSLDDGAALLQPSDPLESFFYVEKGELEVIDPIQLRRVGNATLGPTQFFGEINFLAGGRNLMLVRALKPTRVLAVPRPTPAEAD